MRKSKWEKVDSPAEGIKVRLDRYDEIDEIRKMLVRKNATIVKVSTDRASVFIQAGGKQISWPVTSISRRVSDA